MSWRGFRFLDKVPASSYKHAESLNFSIISGAEKVRWLTFMARRFVAGETEEEAVRAVKVLNSKGVVATLDILGENVADRAEAERYADGYIHLLETIKNTGVDSNVSLKLTMLGLDIDDGFCRANLERVVSRASELDNFVRVDMEGSAYTQRTLDIFKHVYERFGGDHVGIVLQAYLHRTESDLKMLLDIGAPVRLCKGAYKEPADVAIQDKVEVNRNYERLMYMGLEGKGRFAVATHDENLIQKAIEFVKERNIDKKSFEFQMLYGIRRKRIVDLASEGYCARAYVPFGTEWFPYFYRRLRERKENVLFVLKNLFRD